MSTPESQQTFARVVADMQPHQMLQLAISIRDSYLADVRATRAKLDPARLRGLNASIERLRAALN